MEELKNLNVRGSANLICDTDVAVIDKDIISAGGGTVYFEKYSNGFKSVRVEYGSFAAAYNNFTFPERFKTISDYPIYACGFNSQYSSTASNISNIRQIAITGNTLTVYASPYAGLWIKLFYI